MRFIEKGCEPDSFLQWKELADDDWQPSYNDLRNPQKQDVFDALIRDQRGLCCYCESILKENDYHLEHLNPQSAGDGDALDFANFLCSCLRKTEKDDPLHCGQKKGNEVLLVTPLQSDCQSHFTFTGDGSIEGNCDEANSTIKILGLDIPKLKMLREGVLDAFNDPELTLEDFKVFLEKYVEKKDLMKPYISAVECVYVDFL
ncbi:retron system putative HNH endonuclease [Candidatus Enterovibrio escicola]|uniref:retron system putative HNH endonuclease n=1 Tax=Candidatus Enterovibrio escicola TaxID=1927127 RepID=UPI001237EC09|nr:retron system putative HNH endonuclease [Candidatus Enterovibrio escacola]